MYRLIFYFLLVVSIAQNTKAQPLRQFELCDSTEFKINSDTSIIAGRNRLYLKTILGLKPLYNFNLSNPNYFIRDFDIIRPNLWYALIGSRNISDVTTLYKSKDNGITWNIDTSHFTTTNLPTFTPLYHNSINQVQKIGSDTILLFVGYYTSGIIYSTDGGSKWTHWFNNTPSHYFGILECRNSFYLYQMEGDGFRSSIFAFNKVNLFKNDSIVNFNHYVGGSGIHPDCFNGINPKCKFSPNNLTRCNSYVFYKNYVDSICDKSTSLHQGQIENIGLKIYPNPNNGSFTLVIEPLMETSFDVYIFNNFGQIVFKGLIDNTKSLKHNINAKLNSGIYYISIRNQQKVLAQKILIQQ
jgi:hypothetical protein